MGALNKRHLMLALRLAARAEQELAADRTDGLDDGDHADEAVDEEDFFTSLRGSGESQAQHALLKSAVSPRWISSPLVKPTVVHPLPSPSFRCTGRFAQTRSLSDLPSGHALHELTASTSALMHAQTLTAHELGQQTSDFSRLLSLLLSGFSLIVHGIGTKKLLLNTFLAPLRVHAPVVVLNGFSPNSSARGLLQQLACALNLPMPTGGTDAMSSLLRECCARAAQTDTAAALQRRVAGCAPRMCGRQKSLRGCLGDARVLVRVGTTHGAALGRLRSGSALAIIGICGEAHTRQRLL